MHSSRADLTRPCVEERFDLPQIQLIGSADFQTKQQRGSPSGPDKPKGTKTMKTIILAAATALALSAPAFAEQYNGSGNLANFAAKHFAQDHEPGDGPRFFRKKVGQSTVSISTSNRNLSNSVREHFAQDHTPGDGPRFFRQRVEQPTTILSTKNNDLARRAAAHLKNDDERGDN